MSRRWTTALWCAVCTANTQSRREALHIGGGGATTEQRVCEEVSGIRYQVSYLDWGTFSHRLFLQAPSKQKGKEESTKQRQRSVKCESIGSSIVSQMCSIKIN